MVFSERARTDSSPAGYSETLFTHLDRSSAPEAQRVRALVEDFFRTFPSEDKSDLLSRLRSPDEEQHLAAFFELFLARLFSKLGYQLHVHPAMPGTSHSPDFDLSGLPAEAAYVEATVAFHEPPASLAAAKRANVVYDALNRMDSPDFWLGIDIHGAPATPPPARALRTRLTRWLSSLDWDSLRQQLELGGWPTLPSFTYEHEGWSLLIHAIPKPQHLRGTPGVRPIAAQSRGFELSTAKQSMRNSLFAKASAYGELTAPFIIAVNSYGVHTDTEDIIEALFGTAKILVPRAGEAKPQVVLARDGFWIGPNGPRNTQVSAVLVFSRVSPWTVSRRDPLLCINIAPTVQLAGPILNLPQLVIQDSLPVKRAGLGAKEIYSLPDDWPEQSMNRSGT